MVDTLQRSTYVGELSAFDIEKYLKKTDVSSTGNASVAHTTFDLTSWAENLSRNPQTGDPEEQRSSSQQVDSETQKMPTSTKMEERDRRGETTLNTSSAVSLSNAFSAGDKGESKRSSVPCPSTSFSSARRAVGSGQSSTIKPPTEKMGAWDNATSSATKTWGSTGRIPTENGVKPGELNPQASNNTRSSLEPPQNSDKISAVSPGLPRTSPGRKKGKSGLPCFKGYSAPTQRVRSAGQQQQDRPSNFPEKKTPPRNITAAPLPCSSVVKNVGFSCQNIQPPLDPASGE